MHNAQKHITPLGNYDVPTGWPMKPYKRPYGGTPGPPVMYEKPSDPEEEGAGYGYSNGMNQQERDVFFYHSDHLGSTSYITDRDGNTTQFVSYKPYGEALVDEHATSFEFPWKFNGKELDSETGLYYYGARYYEPVLAMWYGVDALTEKYPNMGGYVYCAGNPVKMVDIDGNEPTDEEAARIAAHVYGDQDDNTLIGGWEMVTTYEQKYNPSFRGGLYRRLKDDDSYEYAFATAGTYMEASIRGLDSVIEDLQQPFGGSADMKFSIQCAKEIAMKYRDSELTFIGHSKGGAEAVANAVATNKNALLFNPAAVSLFFYGLSSKNYTASMTVYVVEGEFLDSWINSWMAKPIDKYITLPDQGRGAMGNHSMDSVINALKQYHSTTNCK